jgi:D-alanyl-D-alanine carboxypeptidase (penicillin-binding protein 5/6)
MNRRGREIGLGRAEFRNSTGAGHPEQKMTARELAMLSRHVIETYPDLYPVFGRADFTWNKIRQQNRNPLLTMNIGADGLKTGNIAEAGFGLVGSAVQDGRRLIVVVNGLANARDRAQEARKLLDYGFRSFEARDLYAAGQPVGEVRVFGGQERSVPVAARGLVRILLPRGSAERISVRLGYSGPLLPPVREGDRVATLRVYRGDTLILETPLHAVRSMDKGSLMRRAFDAAEEAIGGWLRGAFAKL